MPNERARAVMARLDTELKAGAAIQIDHDNGNVFVTVTGGTQLTGGCMAVGDTALDALVVAFDMEDE